MIDRTAYWAVPEAQLLGEANSLRAALGYAPLRRVRRNSFRTDGSVRFTEAELRDQCANWARDLERKAA